MIGGHCWSQVKDVYSSIRKDHFLKKIKIFLWELGFGAINMADQLQKWCPICPSLFHGATCAIGNLKLLHICSFIALLLCVFLAYHVAGFGWSTAFSHIMLDNIASLLVGHPFHGTKRTLWLDIVRAFFWTLCEHNKRLSGSSFQFWSFYWFFSLLCCTSANLSHLFFEKETTFFINTMKWD